MSRKRRRRKSHIHPNLPIKPELSFGQSLKKYTFKRLSNTPISWQWVGVGLSTLVVGASIAAGYFSPSLLSSNTSDAVRVASKQGDYALAQQLLKVHYSKSSREGVLGADTELEELAYPEKDLENQIVIMKAFEQKYPNNRDILINLAALMEMAGDTELAKAYRENARILDPNNAAFSKE